GNGRVLEDPAAGVQIEAVRFALESGDEQVRLAVPVAIREVYAHRALGRPVGRECYVGGKRVVTKALASLVDVEVAGHLVVTEVQVGPPIPVDVAECHPQGLAFLAAEPPIPGSVREPETAHILVDAAELRVVKARAAGGAGGAVITELRRMAVV